MFRPGWVGWVLLLAGCDRVLGLDPVPPLPDAAMLAPGSRQVVAEGGAHACGIRRDGSLRCRGDNSAGQLGIGLTNASGPVLVP